MTGALWFERWIASARYLAVAALRAPEADGWEAGIRTPITASRARCPTVERPPSNALVERRETTIIPAISRIRQAAVSRDFPFRNTCLGSPRLPQNGPAR